MTLNKYHNRNTPSCNDFNKNQELSILVIYSQKRPKYSQFFQKNKPIKLNLFTFIMLENQLLQTKIQQKL